MRRSDERILTTHVGSIIRPRALTELSNMVIGPPKDPEEYQRRQAAAVDEVVRHQIEVGGQICRKCVNSPSPARAHGLPRLWAPRPGSRPAVRLDFWS